MGGGWCFSLCDAKMIYLRTGVPGAGKTLSGVQELNKMVARWGAHPDEARPIFVLGVPDLLLPHSPLPLKSVQIDKNGSPSLVPDWSVIPDGSLIFIDEAQGCFPPRSTASKPPEHVAFLNTHRHHGFDIYLTTQHPKLIDGSVRALVGKHQHYRRLFGGMRAMVYEWDSCSDSLSGMNTAIKSYWPYPKNAFKFYKSAEIHTKQRFKLPMWLLIPVVGVLMAAFFVPRAFSVLAHGVSGKGIVSSAEASTMPQLKPVAVVSGVPTAGSMADALASSREAGGTNLYKTSKGGDVVVDRPVEKLRLSPGVYGDDPKQAAHYTADELAIQAINARVLAQNEDSKIYSATMVVAEKNRNIPVTFVKPWLAGHYQ